MKIHFIGIGGEGMYGVARLALAQGHQVSGSELAERSTAYRLGKLGVAVYRTHHASNVQGADLVVRSSAIHLDHVEVTAAIGQDIPLMKRSQCLGMLLQNSGSQTLAIAGAHGKSTITAMVGLILEKAGMDPTMIAGAHVPYFSDHVRIGRGPQVVEACEYDRSFLDLAGDWSLVTSLDLDHLDYYRGGLDELTEAFCQFIELTLDRPNGRLVLCADDELVKTRLLTRYPDIVTYGLQDGWWRAHPGNAAYSESGVMQYHFEVHRGNRTFGEFAVAVPGSHNIQNALGAIVLCDSLGVRVGDMNEALSHYHGIRGRYEKRLISSHVVVIDDYGHTPAEISATMASMKQEFDTSSVVCVYCPKQFHRTKRWLDEFAKQLMKADACVVAPIVPGLGDDESTHGLVSSFDLAQRICEMGGIAVGCQTVEAVRDETKIWLQIVSKIKPDVVLVIGSGTTEEVTDRLCGALIV